MWSLCSYPELTLCIGLPSLVLLPVISTGFVFPDFQVSVLNSRSLLSFIWLSLFESCPGNSVKAVSWRNHRCLIFFKFHMNPSFYACCLVSGKMLFIFWCSIYFVSNRMINPVPLTPSWMEEWKSLVVSFFKGRKKILIKLNKFTLREIRALTIVARM